MRITRWFYGRANHHPYGARRRRLWALLAVACDPDFPWLRRGCYAYRDKWPAKLYAFKATRQPRLQ